MINRSIHHIFFRTSYDPRVADIDNGKGLYSQICLPCHGASGTGGHGGGAPLTSKLTVADVMTVATSGRNQMPSFADSLTGDELQDIGTYITKVLVSGQAP